MNRKLEEVYTTLCELLLYVSLLCVITATLFIVIIFVNIKEINTKLDSKEQIDCNTKLIKVNDVLYDEDDYNQMDWRSYTPVSDSIE